MSNLANCNIPKVSSYEIQDTLEIYKQFFGLEPIRKQEPEKLNERLKLFFSVCSEGGVIPTVELMCVAVGVSRQSLWNWQKEGCKSGEIVTRAKGIINAMMTEYTLQGKFNPVYQIFLQKCNFNYNDSTEIVISTEHRDVLSADELPRLDGEQTINQDLAVDVAELPKLDYNELETI